MTTPVRFASLLTARVPSLIATVLTKVFKIMRDGRGTHFDPDLLDMFLDSANEFLAVSFQSVDEMESFERGAVPA